MSGRGPFDLLFADGGGGGYGELVNLLRAGGGRRNPGRVRDERERAERFAALFRAVYLTFHRRDGPCWSTSRWLGR
jgi:hypothetical protein